MSHPEEEGQIQGSRDHVPGTTGAVGLHRTRTGAKGKPWSRCGPVEIVSALGQRVDPISLRNRKDQSGS